MIKIGIDLSTTNTGVAIIKDSKLIYSSDLTHKKFSESNLLTNLHIIDDEVQRWFELKQIKDNHREPILLGIEISDFYAQKDIIVQNRTHIYLGAILSSYDRYGWYGYNIKSPRWFNSNSWQFKIGCSSKDIRETRKAKARQFAYDKGIKVARDWSEDRCDAFCIAYFLESIESAELKNRRKKEEKRLKRKNKK